MTIQELVAAQRAYFDSGATRPLSFRQEALARLSAALQAHEAEIAAALQSDLNKAPMEAYMTETGMVLAEISHTRKHLAKWSRTRRVRTPLAQFPARSFVQAEPLGVALVMAPWNYPLQLSLSPLVGAIAAGNCAVLKPSAYAPATSELLAKLCAECFDPAFVTVVQGGRAENSDLLAQKFDYIFFTGGSTVGRLVMRAAAEHLTPVTLELGGKSPVIVERSADLALAARRIVFGKLLNAGQTCVAPDYVLVDRAVKPALIAELQKSVTAFLGAEPLQNEELPRIINEKHFKRLLGLMDGAKLAFGGQSDAPSLRIAPTVLDEVSFDDAVMGEEIFGPILPLIAYDRLDEALAAIRCRPKPLALYLFTTDPAAERQVLETVSFGGGCVNDTIIHLATSEMAFGGVGESGMGSYHGKASFDTFSHYKSIVKKSNRLDLPMRYHPYTAKKTSLVRRFLK